MRGVHFFVGYYFFRDIFLCRGYAYFCRVATLFRGYIIVSRGYEYYVGLSRGVFFI